MADDSATAAVVAEPEKAVAKAEDPGANSGGAAAKPGDAGAALEAVDAKPGEADAKVAAAAKPEAVSAVRVGAGATRGVAAATREESEPSLVPVRGALRIDPSLSRTATGLRSCNTLTSSNVRVSSAYSMSAPTPAIMAE